MRIFSIRDTSKLVLISVVLFALHTTAITFTAIGNILPDIMLIWIVYIAITRGQITSTLFGFCIGLIIDFSTGQFLGLTALSKTTAGFIAGYFYNENKIDITLSNYRFLIVVATTSIVHNIIFFILFMLGKNVHIVTVIFQYGLLSTLYTTVIATIPMLFHARKPQFR